MQEEEEWKTQHDKTKLDKKEVKVEEVKVVSCSDDGFIRVWLPTEGNEQACLTGHSDRVIAVAASQNGTICSSSLDRTIKVWKPSLASATPQEVHNAEVSAVACSPSGKYVVTASRDGVVKLWCYKEEDVPSCLYTFKAHEKAVNAACFVGSLESTVVTGSDDATVRVWKMIANKRGSVARRSGVLKCDNPVTSVSVCPGQHEGIVITTEWGQEVRVWDIINGNCLHHANSGGDWLMCSSQVHFDSYSLQTGGTDGNVVFWEIKQGKRPTLEAVRVLPIQYDWEKSTPPNKRETTWVTALGGIKKPLYVGDSHGQLSRVSATDSCQNRKRIHAAMITGVESDKWRRLFTAAKDLTIKIWDQNMEQIGQFFCQAPITSMTLNPESGGQHQGQGLICGDQRGNVSFLNWRK